MADLVLAAGALLGIGLVVASAMQRVTAVNIAGSALVGLVSLGLFAARARQGRPDPRLRGGRGGLPRSDARHRDLARAGRLRPVFAGCWLRCGTSASPATPAASTPPTSRPFRPPRSERELRAPTAPGRGRRAGVARSPARDGRRLVQHGERRGGAPCPGPLGSAGRAGRRDRAARGRGCRGGRRARRAKRLAGRRRDRQDHRGRPAPGLRVGAAVGLPARGGEADRAAIYAGRIWGVDGGAGGAADRLPDLAGAGPGLLQHRRGRGTLAALLASFLSLVLATAYRGEESGRAWKRMERVDAEAAAAAAEQPPRPRPT